MHYRPLGRTGWNVSDVSFGAWAVGGTWGPVDDEVSLRAMHEAVDRGVNFFDTADVYGDGHSERLLRKLKKGRSEEIHIATKSGRRLSPHVSEGYHRESLTSFVDRSRENLGVDTLDLLQLHCPPWDVYYTPEVFEVLEDLKIQGKIQHWGVSVEKIEEGLKAMSYPGCQSVQIIFNIFRQRPSDLLLSVAREKNVGVIARLPLSSGMLTGKLLANTQFAADDHRQFNREGAGFDKGETFSGIPYETGLEAVELLRPLVPEGVTIGQFALRWILMFESITCAIPGGKTPEQVVQNCHASELTALEASTMAEIKKVYDERIKTFVHDRW